MPRLKAKIVTAIPTTIIEIATAAISPVLSRLLLLLPAVVPPPPGVGVGGDVAMAVPPGAEHTATAEPDVAAAAKQLQSPLAYAELVAPPNPQ
jgi:hypothetical protein